MRLPGIAAESGSSNVLTPGTEILGRYEVVRTLGEGGMGFVVAARHKQLGRLDAIKFLLPHMATNDLILERFKREARAAARLDSPHIARVYDADVTEMGEPYIVMEYVDGRDFKSMLQGRPLPIPETLEYLVQVCAGLAVAHRQGIVHRDLKPGNLLLSLPPDESPCVKVVDFGIAKVIAPDECKDLTEHGPPGGCLGTIPYMSPEQLREAQNVDARADIWALGVIAYEMLTSRKPFHGSSKFELVATIIDKENHPDAPTLHRPELPLAIERIIGRCLAKNREDRYGSVLELAAALREAAGMPAPTRLPMASISVSSAPALTALPSEGTQGNAAVTNAPSITLRTRPRVLLVAVGVLAVMVAMVPLRMAMLPGKTARAVAHVSKGIAAVVRKNIKRIPDPRVVNNKNEEQPIPLPTASATNLKTSLSTEMPKSLTTANPPSGERLRNPPKQETAQGPMVSPMAD